MFITAVHPTLATAVTLTTQARQDFVSIEDAYQECASLLYIQSCLFSPGVHTQAYITLY